MASSNKTEQLGLSLWDSTDRPERMDFVKDNEILDRKLGEHLANTLLHVDPGKTDFLNQPFWIKTFRGNGFTDQQISAEGLPRLIIQMCANQPPVIPRADGRLDVYWDFLYAANPNYTTMHTLGGLGFNLKEKRWIAYSGVSSFNDKLVMHMNDSGMTYVTLFLPFTG